MEQAGFNTVQLIENKDLTFKYDDNGNVLDALRGDGSVIDITSDFPINLKVSESRNRNGKIGYLYELDFIELSIENINKIRRSIYGFITVLKAFSLDDRILLIPLAFDKSNQDNNISSSYSTKISNFVKTKQELLPFNDNKLDWILDTGFWNDGALWIDSAIWID